MKKTKKPCNTFNHQLIAALEEILGQRDSAISEYELLTVLQKAPYQLFSVDAMRDTLLMFQSHFILFHCLHSLRDRWLKEQKVELDIIGTVITPLPYCDTRDPSQQLELIKADPLRKYYLNLNNLFETNVQDVENMLESFWSRVQVNNMNSRDVHDCLKVLELPPDAPYEHIKAQYHSLLHTHHPDKGGCTQRAQQIEKAYRSLKKLKKTPVKD